MNLDTMRAVESSSTSCSYSEDVKPNINLISTNMPTRSAALPLNSVDIKQPPPGFSQSCNHKILLSKSFVCKTGLIQGENLPNATNQSIANGFQTSDLLASHFNTKLTNGLTSNNSLNFSQSCSRDSVVSKVPFYQTSFPQNLQPVIPPSQLMRNYHQYPSTCVRNSNAENTISGFSQNVPYSWQAPSVPPSFARPPPSIGTTHNTPVMLPPLNIPPPNFLSNHSTISVPPSQKVNSLAPRPISKSSSNRYSSIASHKIGPPLNLLPPPNILPNIPCPSNELPTVQPFSLPPPPLHSGNRDNDRSSHQNIHPSTEPVTYPRSAHQTFQREKSANTLPQPNTFRFVSQPPPLSFHVQSSSFTSPLPLSQASNLYSSHPISSMPQIKSERPSSCFVENNSSPAIDNLNVHLQNSLANIENSTQVVKRPMSQNGPDCDYFKNNEHRAKDTNQSKTYGHHTRRSRSRSKGSSSTSRNKDNRTRRSSSRSRRSRSRTSCSSSRTRRSSSRTRRSRSRTRCSTSRNRSRNKSRQCSGRSKSSESNSSRCSRPTQSNSRSKPSSNSRGPRSRSKNSTSRCHSKRPRSSSRSKHFESHSKRLYTTPRRSQSRSVQRHAESNHSRNRSSSSPRDNESSKRAKTKSLRDSPNRGHREERKRKRSRSRSQSRSKPGVPRQSRRSRSRSKHVSPTRSRAALSSLDKWRMNNCCSEREMSEKLDSLADMEADQIIEQEKKIWTRSAPSDLYYTKRAEDNSFECTEKTRAICDAFQSVIQTFVAAKESKTPFDYTANRKKIKTKCSHCERNNTSSGSESSEDSSDKEDTEDDNWMFELQLKQNHPDRLHPELWFNDKGEMNDGPLCRCSTKSRRSGIRHNIYAGEEKQDYCNPDTNNVDKLYHYRVTVSPPTNFLINTPTVIEHDNQEFIFEGFSLFSHHPLEKLPTCRVIRFNIQYTIVYIEEKVPEGFSVRDTEIFFDYLFHQVLELVDLDLKSDDKDGCPQFHIMPRFVRELKNNGKELLPMYRVLEYFTTSFSPVISEAMAKTKDDLSTYDWQDFADGVKGMIVVKPGAKPCAMRVDQLDRESETNDIYPDAVHFGSRPLQLCFAGSPDFQKLWKGYVKLRHLVANKPKRTAEDKRRLAAKEQKLQEMRTNSKMKRGVTVAISSRNFYRTGIMCDMVQHAMLIPVLICHLRFHRSLNVLENRIQYKFQNRYLLQLALTHPSYRENFGTNPDHARNSLSNCGVRQPEYGDRRIHFENTRKRGINTLINIMSKLGRKVATESNITHNERLEFLGDAVVEFITSIHLFHVFPDIEEGGLATYRAAIVQNQHLAHLARKLGLEDFMLYAHGSDLCHEVELKHAMANCFEALMGALFLDGGIEVADRVFSCILYKDNEVRFNQWMHYPQHPLQEQEPDGDRHWVKQSPILKQLQYLEFSTGVIFNHIRLLARVFTTRSMGYTNLTLGSNQRLEFLGDTVLQLITSDYLYNHFPEHHEGHLSLLRSSLVNNRTQSVVCNDIGMPFFANLINPKVDLKMKDRADLLEAFLGAMYIDKGMEACEQFCKVCFFPRLQYFILNQEWNDPKSKLQQCCLTLRTLDGGEPDIPIYKVIEHVGPTNSRSYTVAVYFKNKRLAQATGNSIQQAEMNAAKVALQKCPSICPQLDHQKRVIAKSLELQKHEGVVVGVPVSSKRVD